MSQVVIHDGGHLAGMLGMAWLLGFEDASYLIGEPLQLLDAEQARTMFPENQLLEYDSAVERGTVAFAWADHPIFEAFGPLPLWPEYSHEWEAVNTEEVPA